MKISSLFFCAPVGLCLTVSGLSKAEEDEQSAKADSLSFSSQSWCKDSATICWKEQWPVVSGVRLAVDPILGIIIQNGDSRFESSGLNLAARYGFGTNLLKAWIGFDLGLIGPFTATLDERSVPLTTDGSRDLAVDYGLWWGVNFVDGLFSFGMGRIYYDERLFRDDAGKSATSDGFFAFSLNAITAARFGFKLARE